VHRRVTPAVRMSASSSAKEKGPASPKKRLEIVVADDVPEIKDLVALWLEELGHAVTHASDGREVVRLVTERHFDLVITDIVMPQGDGWEAILAINRLRPATRILAISGGGHHMPADACLRVAKGVGADAVLKKPFRQPELVAAVRQIMGR
jgi:two-component system cell cycle response regulator CpdR